MTSTVLALKVIAFVIALALMTVVTVYAFWLLLNTGPDSFERIFN